jgi:DNA-binding transcriptional LysR family regulator
MNRLIALQKIVELGSFTRAGQILGYTQSSMSQMIASLEKELGIRLLTRSRYGVRLTREGSDIYPFIERVISDYRAMREKADEIRGLETGVVRVGTISSVTCHWMPPLILGFKKKYPHVQFVFHQGDYTLIPEWIRSGIIDFGFVNPASTSLPVKTVKSGEMLAVLPENHPLAEKKCVSLEELAQYPFILLEQGNYNELLEAFRKAGVTPDIHYTLHDDYAIMHMVEMGMGVSILAKLLLRRTNYHIVCIPIDPPVYRTLGVAVKDWNELPMASRRFIEYLDEHKNELP